MKTKPRIALAQIKYFDLDTEHNLEKIIYFIKKAKEKKADIVCFPETCMLKEKYLDFSHHFLKEIREACRKNKIWCIITEDFLFGSKIYNTSILIDREGKIRGKYKKIKLYAEKMVNPGKEVHIFKTDFGKIGIAICWDLAFPEIFQKMKKAGAQIVFCPAQWAYEKKAYTKEHRKKELKLLKSLILSRAFENLFFVAFCSPYRDQKDLICYSAIVSQHEIIKEIFGKEGLIFSDIQLKKITKFKRIYPGK
ncbi:MAG: carbon-nitrogen hydrolase family protein [Nanoarchaeota archaeon]|nr:carbon-nitrogen hydrolase family protein [Nanoarchaeota archaeon]